MQPSSSLITCIDHIMIRVSDAIYDQVFSLFTDTLQLPISWDVQNYYPPFKAGGIVTGNISMEIFRSGEQPLYPSQAQIYGIALEATPLPDCLQELTHRHIPHLPPYAIPQAYLSNRGDFYTLIYLGELLGSDLSQFFFSDQIGLGAIDSLIFDRVFPHGTIFLCDFNPTFWNIPEERPKKRALLQEKRGGSLGLEKVQNLIIGVTDLERTQEQWQRLFAPLEPTHEDVLNQSVEPQPLRLPASHNFQLPLGQPQGLWLYGISVEWQFKEGPAIRLIPHKRDEILAMTWKVASLEQARAFLQANGMLGEVTADQVTIAPETACGLVIHLVE